MLKLYFFGYSENTPEQEQDVEDLTEDHLRKINSVVQPTLCMFQHCLTETDHVEILKNQTYYTYNCKLYKCSTRVVSNGVIEPKQNDLDTRELQLPRNQVERIISGPDSICVLSRDEEGTQKVSIGSNGLLREVDFKGKILEDISFGKRINLVRTQEKEVYQFADILETYQPTLSLLHFPTPRQVTAVSCGKEHGVVLTSNNFVWTVGNGSRGQLGLGSATKIDSLECVEALHPVKIISISAGGWHTIVLSESGDMYGWGWNESGQVGCIRESFDEIDCSEENRAKLVFLPSLVDTSLDDSFTLIKTGSRHSVAVSTSGQCFTWGWNGYGQLGHGDQSNCVKPRMVSFFEQNNLKVIDVICSDWVTVVKTVHKDNKS